MTYRDTRYPRHQPYHRASVRRVSDEDQDRGRVDSVAHATDTDFNPNTDLPEGVTFSSEAEDASYDAQLYYLPVRGRVARRVTRADTLRFASAA